MKAILLINNKSKLQQFATTQKNKEQFFN